MDRGIISADLPPLTSGELLGYLPEQYKACLFRNDTRQKAIQDSNHMDKRLLKHTDNFILLRT